MDLVRIADASLTRIDRIITADILPEPKIVRQPDGCDLCVEKIGLANSRA